MISERLDLGAVEQACDSTIALDGAGDGNRPVIDSSVECAGSEAEYGCGLAAQKGVLRCHVSSISHLSGTSQVSSIGPDCDIWLKPVT